MHLDHPISATGTHHHFIPQVDHALQHRFTGDLADGVTRRTRQPGALHRSFEPDFSPFPPFATGLSYPRKNRQPGENTGFPGADRIVVMFNGEIVEEGEPEQVIHAPRHAYTRSLVAAVPLPDPGINWGLETLELPA